MGLVRLLVCALCVCLCIPCVCVVCVECVLQARRVREELSWPL